MSPKRRLFAVVPNYRPVGGIAKMLDYALHADPDRFEAWFAPLSNQHAGSSLLKKPYYERSGRRLNFCLLEDADMRDGDIVLFSLPTDFKHIVSRAAELGYPDIRIAHLIQNVRHNNVFFEQGYARSLLMKDLPRISITDQVHDAVRGLVPDPDRLTLNFHGFDYRFFRRERIVPNSRLRVGYNLFKSDFGARVKARCAELGLAVDFSVARRGVSWNKLRAFYHGCDVFLGTPLREEGYYLPGIEALAGGNILICSDAVGNRSYLACEASLTVGYEDVDDHVEQIRAILAMDPAERQVLRQSAVAFASQFDLDVEKKGFNDFLQAQLGA